MPVIATVAVLMLVTAMPLTSQPSEHAIVGARRLAVPESEMTARPPVLSAATQQPPGLGAFPSWLTPIVSAVVPGAGQLALGQDRFAGYLAIESYGWIRFLRHNADGRRGRSAYRRLAEDVARSVFGGPLPVGNFDYYERMEQYVESGIFDISDEDGLQPEVDELSYNGALWRQARETFWDDPDVPPPINSAAYVRAIEYYRGRAVAADFRWSWRNAQLEQDLFRRAIAGSNEAFRRSVSDLGVILGNHLLSMVDAFVTIRLRQVGRGRDDNGAFLVHVSFAM
jgi:hypothetical protein